MTESDLDVPLLTRIAAGDREAVDACIERYSRMIWSLARGVSRDPNEIEDLVQENFIDVWKSAERFDPSKASETTFVATIARRRVIDRRRRQARRPEFAALEGEGGSEEDPVLERLGNREEAIQAMQLVNALDPPLDDRRGPDAHADRQSHRLALGDGQEPRAPGTPGGDRAHARAPGRCRGGIGAMKAPHPEPSRLLLLAADRATGGLENGEWEELEHLLSQADPEELSRLEELESTAAAIHIAFLPEATGPPLGLDTRLRRRAEELWPAPAPRSTEHRRPWYAHPAAGWAAAAAVLLSALPRLLPERPPSPVERMQALVQAGLELVRAEWAPGPDDLGQGITGEVVWSPARQEGYLRLRALAPNDPRSTQYQLWIFDSRRSEPPVDGGLFDVSDAGEVVIPIDARLSVAQPVLFAITAEPAGGVVVSSRERVVALAEPR
jgi:RNA polymerase sigma factor (sigma-70 family)